MRSLKRGGGQKVVACGDLIGKPIKLHLRLWEQGSQGANFMMKKIIIERKELVKGLRPVPVGPKKEGQEKKPLGREALSRNIPPK